MIGRVRLRPSYEPSQTINHFKCAHKSAHYHAPEETISQKANLIWRQRQIDKLEEEYEVLAAELDSLRDDIGYDRITMDEEDCLVGETIYGLQIQDRLEEIEKELVVLRSKQ